MLKSLISLILLLNISILLSSCISDKPIIIPQQPIFCPKSQRPILIELDNSKTINNIDNIKKILNALNDITEYSLKLEETIECYIKNQPKDSK